MRKRAPPSSPLPSPVSGRFTAQFTAPLTGPFVHTFVRTFVRPFAKPMTGVLAAVLMTGCSTVQEPARPSVELPAAWRIDVQQSAAEANLRWWVLFGDPVLDALITTALRENRDLLIAAARVDQFTGQLSTTRSQFYPQIGYSADAARSRASRVGQPALPPGADPYFSLYQGALGASWQIDLFGRVRLQSQAAQAQLLASEQGRRGVVLSVVTSVAASYVALRGLDRQLEIARATAQNHGETLKIFTLRFAGGVVSEVEVSQVESQYQQALAAIPAIEQQIAAQENLISTLLGRPPAPVARGKSIDELLAPEVPGALPATLLERRPDILQAEQNLAAASANVGVARTLYFPSFSLTGTLGSVSTAFGDFLSGPATAWALAAGVAGPLFTFGAIDGQVQGAEAAQREAQAGYQKAVLVALRETNDALQGTLKARTEAQAQARRVTALRTYARLSRLKFDNGYAGFLEVLYAENELFSAELAAVRTQIDRHTRLIEVYKALGGGWIDEAGQLAPPPLLGQAPAAAGPAAAR